jgi:hypothetical protein
MRTALLPWLVAVLALPAFAGSERTVAHVTVEQLERTLAVARGEPDRQIALQLADIELTERLSTLRRARLEAELPGPEAQQALRMLTDSSQFLDLPAADVPSTPTPDHAAQVAMLALARNYVVKTILKLPNFFATRETVNFEGAPAEAQSGTLPSSKFEPLHETSHSSVTVLYRDNKEMIAKDKGNRVSTKQMRTMGEFGPILVTVLNDAAKGRVIWSHWEQGALGAMAVFQYKVAEQASHYLVGFSSVEQGDQHDPAYHGEIAINPADGSILRLTVLAEMKLDNPIETADMLVDYGPVEIGGATYTCPIRSVAYSLVRMVVFDRDFNTGAVLHSSLGVPRSYLNEVLFTQYHLFRAETRILTGSGEEPAATTPTSVPR